MMEAFIWLLWALAAAGALLAALLAAALVRAARLKPTGAAAADFPPADMARAAGYAEGLGRLVACETAPQGGDTGLQRQSAL